MPLVWDEVNLHKILNSSEIEGVAKVGLQL